MGWIFGFGCKVLTTEENRALKVRVFGKKITKTSRKPHANLTQKQKRTHDLT
jgi:hypothetical protein